LISDVIELTVRFGFALLLVILLGGFMLLPAQSSTTFPPRPDSIRADKNSPQEEGPPLTSVEEEMRAKRAIKYAEKEHQENLDRAGQLATLGKELSASYKKKNLLDREDIRRLDKLEKLTRKIRTEAGGEDSETALTKPPGDLGCAITKLEEVATSVGEQFKKTPRQVISTNVIDEANVLLEIIKLVRGMASAGPSR
jgi:hypothetical protein